MSLVIGRWSLAKDQRRTNYDCFLSLAAAADDERIRPLVVARLISAGRLAPRSHRVTSARGLAFTTAVRMVHRIHNHAAIGGLNSQPARASRFSDGDVF